MSGKKIALVFLLFVGIALLGCPQPGPDCSDLVTADDSGATPEDALAVANGNNAFAFDLYQKLKDGDKENVFFSPWSISSAFGMVYEGAKGETAGEIQGVLKFPSDSETRLPGFALLYNTLNKCGKPYALNTANAIWVQQNFPFKEDYISIIENRYAGKVTNMDFAGNAEGARQTINSWVEEQTNNKIKNLIPPGVLNAFTRLVLTNAIYFKGDWDVQFEKAETKKEEFRASAGSSVMVDMMHMYEKEESFNYMENDDLQMLELPYKGEEISMLILLPKDDDIETINSYLNAAKLSELKAGMRKAEVEIFLPKFEFETKYFMNDTLREMGMETPFSPAEADFTKMADIDLEIERLYITDVIHQAYVKVDEEGTEAAAATAIIMGITTAMPNYKIFRADHPFIFIIQEKGNGGILFMGKMGNPNA
ncbi:MAG: serpin family protein [Candidatus Diapherotrites archaeon]|nr:serpin family protein [Candidatus Diapherotrites archaeon]